MQWLVETREVARMVMEVAGTQGCGRRGGSFARCHRGARGRQASSEENRSSGDAPVSAARSSPPATRGCLIGTTGRLDTEDARQLEKFPGCKWKQVGALLLRVVARFFPHWTLDLRAFHTSLPCVTGCQSTQAQSSL